MKNQRLMRVIELMGEGNLATAEDLIKTELDERAASAKDLIKRTLVGSVLESEVVGAVKDLGSVTLDARRGQIRLEVSGVREAVEKCAAFAAFCDGTDASKYRGFLNESKTAVVIETEGKSVYEMPLEDDQLVNTCDVTSEDLLQFKKNGTLASV